MRKTFAILLLTFATQVALAGPRDKHPTLELTVVTAAHTPLTTARFWLPSDTMERYVNTVTGQSTLSVRYNDDGTEAPLVYEETIELYVAAPGYEQTKHIVTIDKKKRVKSTVVLPRLSLRPIVETHMKGLHSHGEMVRAFGQRDYQKATEWAQLTLRNVHAEKDEHSFQDALYHAKTILALSALGLWENAANRFADTLSDENAYQMQATRDMADTRAREWLEITRHLGKDETLPLQVCRSTSPSRLLCK